MNELFTTPETKSPRLKWLDQHGIWTRKVEYDHAGPTESEDLWKASAAGMDARGADEAEAIVNLAKKMKIRLWNEL